MLRIILMAAALQLGLGGVALACEGQTGAVIFEDSFADDSGGWELTPPQATISPPAFLLAPNTVISAQNLTFNAVDGDYCATVKLPPAPATDNSVAFGLLFWATDYSNLMAFMIYTNKAAGLYKKTADVWTTVFSVTELAAIDMTPDALNTVRVQAKAGKIKLLVNDVEVKSIRAQVPPGNLRFGVYSQIDVAVDPVPAVQVTSFTVTAGE